MLFDLFWHKMTRLLMFQRGSLILNNGEHSCQSAFTQIIALNQTSGQTLTPVTPIPCVHFFQFNQDAFLQQPSLPESTPMIGLGV